MGDLLLGQAGDGRRRGAPCWRSRRATSKNFGERVIGYGHFVSDDGRDTLGTSFFMQLDDRAAADKFLADEPMNKAGVYRARRDPPLVEQLRQARGRLRPQGPAAVPVHGTQDRHAGVLPRAPARARILLRVVWRKLHLPRTDPLGRRRRQHRHRAAARTARPRGGGRVLEQGAVRQERRLSARCAHHAVGVRGLRGAGHFAATIAVTSTSTIISGNASALTPIRVCTGNLTPPHDSPMHLPIVRRWRRSVM